MPDIVARRAASPTVDGLRLLPHADRPGTARKIPRWPDCPRRTSSEQLLDLRSGERKPAGPEAYLPSRAMLKIAQGA